MVHLAKRKEKHFRLSDNPTLRELFFVRLHRLLMLDMPCILRHVTCIWQQE